MATVVFHEQPGCANGQQRVGFDAGEVERWIGLKSAASREDLETCPRSHAARPRAEPAP